MTSLKLTTIVLFVLMLWTTYDASFINVKSSVNAASATGGQTGRVASATSFEPKVRTKRGAFWNFFQKVGITKNLIVEQYIDTKNTFNQVYNMINSQFSDPAASKPTRSTTTTEKPKTSSDDDDSSEPSTTTEAYKISRYELGRILGRNFRGLQRLAKIEFKEALNATKYNLLEYKAEADKQFANSLGVQKKNQLKTLKGLTS